MRNAGKRKTGSKVEVRPPFEVATGKIEAGTTERVELPVARLPTGTSLSLPISVCHGLKSGPVLWLNAAIHGDELNGIAIVRNVLESIDCATLRGTVIAAPVVNIFGLLNSSRYLPDRRDLNRSFPGSKRGSLAAQLAHLFTTEVVDRCDVGIDLHTGSKGRTNLPQLRCDLEDPRTRAYAMAFATPAILHAKGRDGSLRAAARARGKPVLVYEAGEANRFDPRSIEIGTSGVLRVMHHLGMLPEAQPKPEYVPKISTESRWERARSGGFCQLHVALGENVNKGQTVAKVFRALEKKEITIRAQSSGFVVGHVVEALVNRGDALVHIALGQAPGSDA